MLIKRFCRSRVRQLLLMSIVGAGARNSELNILTLYGGLLAPKLFQRHNLSLDVSVSIYEDRGSVPFGITFNTHVRLDLAELDVSKFSRHLPP